MSDPAPLPNHVFNYYICPTWELSKFLESRPLGVTSTTRRQALRELQKANETSAFRSLDSSPELCNQVYHDLLTLRAVPNMMCLFQLATARKITGDHVGEHAGTRGGARVFGR